MKNYHNIRYSGSGTVPMKPAIAFIFIIQVYLQARLTAFTPSISSRSLRISLCGWMARTLS